MERKYGLIGFPLSHSFSKGFFAAEKKEIVAKIEKTKERITKKFPNCPGSRCSPMNLISIKKVYAVLF